MAILSLLVQTVGSEPLTWDYRILSSIVRTFLQESDAEVFPVLYTWEIAEKGFNRAFMTNKLAMINSCEIILEK